MADNAKTFHVVRGLEGMNKLAQFLNASHLAGWHFGSGTRFDRTEVTIDFDDPTELFPTWKRYCDAQLAKARRDDGR